MSERKHTFSGNNPEHLQLENARKISDKDRAIIHLRADLRRRTFDLKETLANLQEPDVSALKKHHRQLLESLVQESHGIRSIESVPKNVQSTVESYIQKAEQNRATPVLRAYELAKAAKYLQAGNVDFSEILEQAKIVTSGIEYTVTTPISDLIPDAIIIGIETRATQSETLPRPDVVASLVTEDKKLLMDYALVLSENEREQFLAALSPMKRRLISGMIDRELAAVLKGRQISNEEHGQKDLVKNRAVKELSTIIRGDAPDMDRYLVKLLSKTLGEFDEKDARDLLKDIGYAALEETSKTKKDNTLLYAARIIRTLLETDSFTGGQLAMKLLSDQELNPHYFAYFRNYLYTNGLLTKNLDQAGALWTEKRCQELYQFLKERDVVWQDESNVNRTFEQSVAVFGYKKMFLYAGRSDVTPHDALFAMGGVLQLCKQSGLTSVQFYGNVLNQIRLDSSHYENGTAYHEFNAIAQQLDLSEGKLVAIKKQAQRYPNITRLQELSQYFKDQKTILASWANLKKYADLIHLIGQTEVLKALDGLKQEAQTYPRKAKLFGFIELLALHPDSKVSMEAVLQFWRDPKNFFARDDAQMCNGKLKELHEAIQPSNYSQLQFLDFSAAHLRDAVVEGALDRVQVFPPMEIIYSVSEGDSVKVELGFHDQVRHHVGSRASNNANAKLFNEIRKILREYEIDAVSYLGGKSELIDKLSASAQAVVREKITEAIRVYPNENIKSVSQKITGRYRARINYKSDPQAVLAGNDTSCCMPFGSGKNNNYMVNPTVGLFTLEEERGNRWRTIAQSVVTLDYDLGNHGKVADLFVGDVTAEFIEKIPETVLMQHRRILACDNIELAPNAKAKVSAIKSLYSDFFKKYVTYFNKQSTRIDVALDESKVVIGQGNSDARFGEQEENTYLPTSLIGYSDKMGNNVDVIRLGVAEKSDLRIQEDSIRKEEMGEKQIVGQPTGILPLFSSDSLAVGFLESKAYPANMRKGLPMLQNYIIAAEINNQYQDRKNYSIKYIDSNRKMKGYLIAYEGMRKGEPIVYVEDLAADPAARMAGGRLLIEGFIKNYQKFCISRGRFLPIFMQAREETTYAIIRKRFKKFAEQLGIELDVEEVDTRRYGNSTMHDLLLTPRMS